MQANYCAFGQAAQGQVQRRQFGRRAVGFKWKNPMPVSSVRLFSDRTYICAWCQSEVRVCTQCDRGQRYCSANCRQQSRRACQRRASACYQSSRVGCINHARRQQQYRERKRQETQRQERGPGAEQIVTQQGSQDTSAGDLLACEIELDEIKSQADAPASQLHCHWCGRAISGVRRLGWLRYAVQDEPDHRLNGEPCGQSP